MRVAILSCGPSLRSADFGPFDMSIGVNSAVENFPCDIWCACDHNVFADCEPMEPFPWGVWTLGPIRPQFVEMDPKTETMVTRVIPESRYLMLCNARHWDKRDYEFNGFEGFGNRSPIIWKRFTIISALMLAYMIGATKIDVYGHDMLGDRDWKGKPGRRPSDRDAERWRLEREAWDLVVNWIGDRGVQVDRMA